MAIILTPAQANLARGLTVLGHALAPLPLSDGTYFLPEDVLNDPAHSKLRAALALLPKVPDENLPPPSGDQDAIDASTYDPTWEVGKLRNAPAPIKGLIRQIVKP